MTSAHVTYAKLCLTLCVDEIRIIKRNVDASYATHNDCRGYIGAIMTLGGGAITSFSRKHRINTKSSTEAELIAVDNAPQILWTWYFLEEQEYTIEKNILYQDNQSAMMIETNG